MPQQQQQPNQSLLPFDMRTGFNICTYCVDVWCVCLWLFTRCRMGKHGMGMAGFWAMIVIPIYAGLNKSHDMHLFWSYWMAMAIFRRITYDPAQDSRFRGFVWMFSWCTNSEMTARLLEAASMPLIGALVSAFSADIGRFITLGTFPFAYRYVLDAMTVARRQEAAHNAIREMEAMQVYFQRERSGH